MKVKVKTSVEKRKIIKLEVKCSCGYTYVIEFLDEELAELEKNFLKSSPECIFCQEENRIGMTAIKYRR
jgi:hypothetical protein